MKAINKRVSRYSMVLSILTLFPLWPLSASITFSQNGTIVTQATKEQTSALINTQPRLVTQSGHSMEVNSVEFSPDGRLILTGRADYGTKTYEVILWELSTGREIRRFAGFSPTFSPNGRLILIHNEGSVILWDVTSGREVRHFDKTPRAQDQIRHHSFPKPDISRFDFDAMFSPDSNYVLIGDSLVGFSEDGRFVVTNGSGTNSFPNNLYEVSSGRVVKEFKDEKPTTNSEAQEKPSPDKKNLLSATPKPQSPWAILWNVATGKAIATFPEESATTVHGRLFLTTCESEKTSDYSRLVYDSGPLRLRDVETGKLISSFELKTDEQLIDYRLTPDDSLLLIRNRDHKVQLRHAAGGKDGQQFEGSSLAVFSPDARFVLTANNETTKLWNISTGKEVWSFTADKYVNYAFSPRALKFSADGRSILIGGSDFTARLIESTTGKEIKRFAGNSSFAFASEVSPDGRFIVTGNEDKTARFWDLTAGREVRRFTGFSGMVNSIKYSPDGQVILTMDKPERHYSGENIRLWDSTGHQLFTDLHLHSGSSGYFYEFLDDDRLLILKEGEDKKSVLLLDLIEKKVLREFEGAPAGVSKDGRFVLTKNEDKKNPGASTVLRLWDAKTGAAHQLEGDAETHFSSDNKFVVTEKYKETLNESLPGGGSRFMSKYQTYLWDVATGQKIMQLDGNFRGFSSDNRFVSIESNFDRIEWWSIATGDRVQNVAEIKQESTHQQDSRPALREGGDGQPCLFENGKQIRCFKHTVSISSSSLSPDGRYVLTVSSQDGMTRIWDASTGQELCQLISFLDSTWAVIDREGRFDASNGGDVAGLHWVVNNESIALSQLKERYYEPGLLAKLMGFNKEPLRDVSGFENPKLNPDVKYSSSTKGTSTANVTLTNRGGGIGRVQVFVNGKEFLADARDDKLKRNPNVAQAMLAIDLSRATGAITGNDNDVRVVAWNVENYISSRGVETVWTADGTADRAPPEVYAIIGGISNYAGSQLNLSFAAKDAVDIANAIELGAKRLFGADKVHLTLLSTAEDPRAIAPTKDNFTKAFEAARKAKPTDILIVYLAGHGITLQRGSDMYCYLTKEARTTDTAALSDSAVRKQETITSEELVDWIKQIPALKQVVMLDTCAAGAAQAQLKLVDKREASGDAIRAIDRAKDRTGSYILMGSAADAVSYEASQYGQGLLTYALLKGMKGAALRNDEFVDVSKLFQYAREEVEQMAKNIGGIQRPIIFAPKDDSFEVGQLKTEDKAEDFAGDSQADDPAPALSRCRSRRRHSRSDESIACAPARRERCYRPRRGPGRSGICRRRRISRRHQAHRALHRRRKQSHRHPAPPPRRSRDRYGTSHRQQR